MKLVHSDQNKPLILIPTRPVEAHQPVQHSSGRAAELADNDLCPHTIPTINVVHTIRCTKQFRLVLNGRRNVLSGSCEGTESAEDESKGQPTKPGKKDQRLYWHHKFWTSSWLVPTKQHPKLPAWILWPYWHRLAKSSTSSTMSEYIAHITTACGHHKWC